MNDRRYNNLYKKYYTTMSKQAGWFDWINPRNSVAGRALNDRVTYADNYMNQLNKNRTAPYGAYDYANHIANHMGAQVAGAGRSIWHNLNSLASMPFRAIYGFGKSLWNGKGLGSFKGAYDYTRAASVPYDAAWDGRENANRYMGTYDRIGHGEAAPIAYLDNRRRYVRNAANHYRGIRNQQLNDAGF